MTDDQGGRAGEEPSVGIYEELGVTPYINACATHTRYGGSIMPEPVVQAMIEASRRCVNIFELQEKVGKAIAALTHNEAGYVSCGAASGLLLVMAACMAGTDEEKGSRLPDTEGMKNEVIIHRLDRGTEADVAIRASGATMIDIGDRNGATEQELLEAINVKTAAVVMVDWEHPGKIPLDRMVAIARDCGVPIIVDAADRVPPKENLWRFTRDGGADAVVISGGKGIRGPQTTGLVLGTRSLIDGCAYHGSPNLRIGRGMKVGKEELVGAYAAVKHCMAQDEDEIAVVRERQIDHIVEQLADLPSVKANKVSPTRIELTIDEHSPGMSPMAVRERLLQEAPSILLGGGSRSLAINAATLQPGEERIIAARLRSLFGYDAPARTR